MLFAFDPRGDRIGGIETFVRDYIEHLPDDFRLLLVGMDQAGDLDLGRVVELEFRGRAFDFMPVLRSNPAEDNVYATRLARSLTLRFFLAAVRHVPAIRRYVRRHRSVLEFRRIEYFPLSFLVGAPYVQMLHDGKVRGREMSSLIRKHWWINDLCEKYSLSFAKRFYCVSADLTKRLSQEHPRHAAKIATLTTWYNPRFFQPAPFDPECRVLRVLYAGRLDRFKRPDVMFSVIAELAMVAPMPVQFHYVGDGDPEDVPNFDAIRALTVLRGKRKSGELGEIYAGCDVGILTSDFEGMPRMVLELLAAGRPVVALHLPQLEEVVRDGTSGVLVPRSQTQVADMARAILNTFEAIRAGRITPDTVADAVAGFTPDLRLRPLFETHRRLRR